MISKNLVGWLARCPVGDNIDVHPTTRTEIENTGHVVVSNRSIGIKVKGGELPQTLGHKPLRVKLFVPPNEIWFCEGLMPKLIITYKDNAQ